MSVVVGVDAGSRSIAFCAFWKDECLMAKAQLKSPFTTTTPVEAYDVSVTFMERVQSLLHGLSEPVMVFLEGAVVAGRRNIQSTIKQAMVSGAIQVAFADNGAYVLLVPISTWKAGIGIGGNASKQDVRECIRRHGERLASLCTADQDRYDACGLALYGQTVVRRYDRLATPSCVPRTSSPIFQSARLHI